MNEPLTKEQAEELWNQLDAEDSGNARSEVDAPSETVQNAAAQQDAAPAASNEAPAADPYEGLPASVRDELVGLKALVSQLTGRVRNAEGHIGGIKSQIQTSIEAARAVTAAGGEAPSAAEIRNAQSNPEAFEQLKKDYPEFAEAISSFVARQIEGVRQQAPTDIVRKDELSRLRDEVRQDLRTEMEREFRVSIAYPDWKQLVVTPEFIGWHEQQKPEVRALASSADPRDAIRLLDLFHESRKPQEAREQRLASAAALPAGRGTGVRVKPIEEMTPEEYWAYLDEEDRRKAPRR